jgi:hypothetical protein
MTRTTVQQWLYQWYKKLKINKTMTTQTGDPQKIVRTTIYVIAITINKCLFCNIVCAYKLCTNNHLTNLQTWWSTHSIKMKTSTLLQWWPIANEQKKKAQDLPENGIKGRIDTIRWQMILGREAYIWSCDQAV